MTRQTWIGVLVAVTILLVLLPLLGMIGMMGMGACCSGLMGGMPGGMMTVWGLGLLWMVLATVVVIALLILIVRGVTWT
jgi:hypothetical protein